MLSRSVLTAITAVLGLLASGPILAQSALAAASSVAAGPDRAAVTTKLPDGLSESDWAGIRKAYTVERHRVAPLAGQAGVWQARNPGQAWRTQFDGRGFRVAPDTGGWTWGLELSRYGIGDARHEVGGTAPVTTGATRVSYAWGAGLEEWFINDSRGLEHGFTLRERPGSGPGPLTLELAVRGGLLPVAQPSGRAVSFLDARGTAVVTYAGLTVLDADGRELPARLEVAATALKIVVADQDARYPVTIDPVAQQAYLKASNTDGADAFGNSVAVSGDTAVVGAPNENSCDTGVDGDEDDDLCNDTGAAYVFLRTAGIWSQQAYLKASNTNAHDSFGFSVAISGDTVVVGADTERSCAKVIDGDETSNACALAGAAYVFLRTGVTWAQQAYLKASNTDGGDRFGHSVAISGDTAVVGARAEESCDTVIGGDETDNSCTLAGAAYVFLRTGVAWTQQAYLKASNTDADDSFGFSVAVSGDTVVVAADNEESCATVIDGDEDDDLCNNAGAAYVFLRTGVAWAQQAYLKASNTDGGDRFGFRVAVSGDTAVVGASQENSCATVIDGDEDDDLCNNAGAAYVFLRTGVAWAQQAYLKASNTDASDQFGYSVAVSGDTAIVGARNEDSCATVIDGDEDDDLCGSSGAAYVFALPPGGVIDPTGDTDNAEIDIESANVTDDGTTLSCILKVATTDGLLNKSMFRCHIDFDDEENSDLAGKGCDLAASTAYRLGTNSLCTTADIALVYRIGKRGGSCTGLPSVTCSEVETNAGGAIDTFCDGDVESDDDAVSCTITITGSLDDIADVRDAECSVGECLTDKDGTTGEYDVYGFFDSQYKGDRDRVLDTDDNLKPNAVDEVTTLNLIDPTLP